MKVYRAIGLMSGTSLDGAVDVALIETDGREYIKALDFYSHVYEASARELVRGCFGKRKADAQTKAAEEKVTDIHIAAVKESGFKADVIGFHGQTIFHDPDYGFTWQLGDGARMAKETGMVTVNDFRRADITAGGQGAPLAPLYHKARVTAQGLELPVVFLNIGGVANVTSIGWGGEIVAFDCGPGNALMDDYTRMKTGESFDRDGQRAAAGEVYQDLVKAWLDHEFFYKRPPKSLDRNEWNVWGTGELASDLNGLGLEDGLATLLEFTVRAIEKADIEHLPGAQHWYACGGGRHNKALMKRLSDLLPSGIEPVEALGWNGDATEAECFAYLAVRSLLGLPISLPETTGVPEPLTGGRIYKI